MKILYLEDNLMDSDLTRLKLEQTISQCILDIAPTLKEAKKCIEKNNNYDIILTDVELPDGNGLELLVDIRQQALPMAVIILTGIGDEEAAIAALKAGADDYIIKKEGYLEKLPQAILIAINNFKTQNEIVKQVIRVLYIEPNKADIELTIKHLLQYAPNIHIDNVSDGLEALKLLPLNSEGICNYDIVLMDYRLQGASTLEVIREIKQERNLKLAIVMVTGHGNEEIAVNALRLGADEYLIKRKHYLFRLPSILISAYQRNELQRKQEALHISEERFRRLAENAQDIIYRLELKPDFRISYISPATTAMTGYTPEEQYANPQVLIQLVHPDDKHIMVGIIKGKLPAENPYVMRWQRKDGKIIWTEHRNVPIFDKDNKMVAFEGIARDITHQKKIENDLRESESKYRLLAENSGDVIFVFDKDFRYKYVSPAVKSLRGYSPEEVLNQTLEDVLMPESYKYAREEIASEMSLRSENAVAQKFSKVLELEMKCKNGNTVWVEAKISLLKDDKNIPIGFLGVSRDISQRKAAELALIIAKEKAEESDRLKSAFLANMSHEIRTPMNGIIGFTNLLRSTGDDKEKRERYLHIINNSCVRLLDVINDIIDISKIESGSVTVVKSEFNVNFMLNELYEFFKPSADNKNLSFNKFYDFRDQVAFIYSDVQKIRQTMNNLINNAIKFSSSGSINFGYRHKKKYLEFFVKDTGIGVDKKEIDLIFERFRQAKNTFGGTGLGLSIARSYIETLGGKMYIESEKEKGSVFRFAIPYEIEENRQKMIKPTEELLNYNWSSKCILVVEDEEDAMELLSVILLGTKVKIIEAINGEEGYSKFKSSKPDLILMDIRMPVMDGLTATKKIRSEDKQIPIIALTAYAMQEDQARSINAGCNDYISKPFTKEILFRKISKFFGTDT